MAIYHCSAQVVSRGGGRSAVAAAAYRSGTQITNEYDGVTHNYTFKEGVVYSEVMLPENAPERYRDRAVLWNEIELSERANGQLAREYEFSIPVELPRDEWARFARDTVNDIFVSKGMIADFAIHDKETDGTENPHVHVMVPMRPLDKNGAWEQKTEQVYLCKNARGEECAFTKDELARPENAGWEKQHRYSKGDDPKARKIYLSEYDLTNPKYKGYARVKNDRQPKTERYGRKNPTIEYWNSKEFLMYVRENVAVKINGELERMGLSQRVDHRSLKDQGIDREPTIHEGVAARQMEKKRQRTGKGEEPERVKTNLQIKANNAELAKVKRVMSATERSIGRINEDMTMIRLHEMIVSAQMEINRAPKDRRQQLRAAEVLAAAEKNVAAAMARGEQFDYHADTFYIVDDERIGYWDFYKAKFENDVEYLKGCISQNLEEIERPEAPHQEERRVGSSVGRPRAEQPQASSVGRPRAEQRAASSAEQPRGSTPAGRVEDLTRADLQREDLTHEDLTRTAQPVTLDVDAFARQLEAHRAAFVEAAAQAFGRTSYRENPAYRQQAVQISECVSYIKGYATSIENLRAEKEKLGVFHGKGKKILQSKIDDFVRLRHEKETELMALGVADPSKADEAIREKQNLAEQEKAKVQAARTAAEAPQRAEAAKAAYIELAKTVPAELRPVVFKRMEQDRDRGGMKTMEHYKAEVEAQKQLDTVLKPALQQREERQQHKDSRER